MSITRLIEIAEAQGGGSALSAIPLKPEEYGSQGEIGIAIRAGDAAFDAQALPASNYTETRSAIVMAPCDTGCKRPTSPRRTACKNSPSVRKERMTSGTCRSHPARDHRNMLNIGPGRTVLPRQTH